MVSLVARACGTKAIAMCSDAIIAIRHLDRNSYFRASWVYLAAEAEASTFRLQPSKGGLEIRSDQRKPHRRCQQPYHHQPIPIDASEEGAGQDR